jgi:Epoxide hydrolase N terminus
LHIEVVPYHIHVTDEALHDLRERLKHTRWPDEIQGARWEYSAKLAFMQDLVSYRQRDFDWRVCDGYEPFQLHRQERYACLESMILPGRKARL